MNGSERLWLTFCWGCIAGFIGGMVTAAIVIGSIIAPLIHK